MTANICLQKPQMQAFSKSLTASKTSAHPLTTLQNLDPAASRKPYAWLLVKAFASADWTNFYSVKVTSSKHLEVLFRKEAEVVKTGPLQFNSFYLIVIVITSFAILSPDSHLVWEYIFTQPSVLTI